MPSSRRYIFPLQLKTVLLPKHTLIFTTAGTPTIYGITGFTSAGTGNILLLSTAITNNNLNIITIKNNISAKIYNINLKLTCG